MAGQTPRQKYPSTLELEFTQGFPTLGPQAATPMPMESGGYQTTPLANPAAVRAYTRNAPYMEQFMSDPQTMLNEIMRLRQELADKPDDLVNEYRLRVLTKALGDVFNMGEKDARVTAAITPKSAPSYLGMQTTGKR